MILQKIDLENIGCYTTAEFSFSNLTTIYGENRTGKSTLVYSLFFSLFGKHLNNELNAGHLCRIGESFGVSNLYFKQNNNNYRIARQTDGQMAIYHYSHENSSWSPFSLSTPDELRNFNFLSRDVAALTSFFREGELIYFFKDIPKYNKTLLQNLIQMDEVFITQSRFKKAMMLARDEKKNLEKSIPPTFDSIVLEEYKKQVYDLEIKSKSVEKEYLLLSKQVDPELFKMLQKQLSEKQNKLEAILKRKKSFTSSDDLKTKIEDIKKQISENKILEGKTENIQRELGKLDQEMSNIQMEIKNLKQLNKRPNCNTCGQSLSKNHVVDLVSKKEKRLNSLTVTREGILKELKKQNEANQTIQKLKDEYTKQSKLLNEVEHIDKFIHDLNNDLNDIKKSMEQFKNNDQDNTDIEKKLERLKDLENIKSQLQKRIINAKVELKQNEEKYKSSIEKKDLLKKTVRNNVLFEVANKCIDKAIQSVNRDLLNKVKESLKFWSDRFTFLNQFDIEITPMQLTPIIQARGYQYKLNQMSKSERIFLYLMLKLTIGDALSHLGLFVLDDPADGLDEKRRELLAHLLLEISENRQIIVTTNNKSFAALFPAKSRVNI